MILCFKLVSKKFVLVVVLVFVVFLLFVSVFVIIGEVFVVLVIFLLDCYLVGLLEDICVLCWDDWIVVVISDN